MNLHGSPHVPSAVPAFLAKLKLLVDDEDTNDLIYWDPVNCLLIILIFS